MRRVLLLVPDAALRTDLVRALKIAGYDTVEAGDASAARERLQEMPAGAALVDVRDRCDLHAIEVVTKCSPGVHVVALGRHPSMELVVDAMRGGAGDFLRMPFDVQALESALAGGQPGEASSPGILTQDPAMEQLLRHARAAAATEATVRIVGESGTGKDLLARHVHQRSPRRSGPFVAVNCAGLSETLAESELFGHERGAFTGAVESRSGQIAGASGGTLLLDEVSDLSPGLQPKLLRVLQERELQPLGASIPQPVDVRVIATTQHDLGALVDTGRFRADLYYRLDVITLQLPPLRERLGDIRLLAGHFLTRLAQGVGAEAPLLTDRAVAALLRHPFRGNVRELENLMRRAVVLFPGREIDASRLLSSRPGQLGSCARSGQELNLRELERRTVARSLQETGGNRTVAAEMLGISVRTLRNKIRLYGLA